VAAAEPNNTHGFKPGVSGNPNGRPLGARGRGSYELRERLKARGGKDPAEFLSDIISSSDASLECKIQASGQLMPYYHSKLGAIPVEPEPRFMGIDPEILSRIQEPKSIEEVYGNIGYLSHLKANGTISIESADSLINDQKIILSGMVDDIKIRVVNGATSQTQRIVIEGGLPQLPGCENLIMPPINEYPGDAPLNGHATTVVDPQPPGPDHNDGL
jgi:hypothetical protein